MVAASRSGKDVGGGGQTKTNAASAQAVAATRTEQATLKVTYRWTD